MAIGTWDLGLRARARAGRNKLRDTADNPLPMLHESSSLLGACCIAGAPSDVVPFRSVTFVASHFPRSTRTPPRKWCASPGKFGTAFVGIGLSESCGTYWASTGCAEAAMRRPSSRLSCPMMPCSLLLDGPQRQIQIQSRIESHHHGACCQAAQGAETSRPKRDEPTHGLHSTAQCSVPRQYASRPHLQAG